ncbi:MAG: Tellurium resistance protein TerA [Pseudomonadota bacterium]
MSEKDQPMSASQHSIMEATKSRAKFSGHGGGKALGAAGYVSDTDDSCDFLATTGQRTIFNPPENGFGDIIIGAAWQNIKKEQGGFLNRLMNKATDTGVDLDLGVLYELHNGKRGCVQAFGGTMGNYETEPYLLLNGDDRTGDDDDDDEHGNDEVILLNGQKWPEIKRLLIYLYIYKGVHNWAEIAPQVQVLVPNERPMVVTLHTYKSELCLAATARMENVRNGIRMTNITEYYPGHPSMDRAFGFGIEWEDGQK